MTIERRIDNFTGGLEIYWWGVADYIMKTGLCQNGNVCHTTRATHSTNNVVDSRK